MNGPYRGSSGAANRCTSCGAELAADARLCAQCGAERPAVRCGACMTLNPVGTIVASATEQGTAACASCGAALGLEPEPVPTQLLCPRGCGPLSALAPAEDDAAGLAECERCGGLFVANATLARLVADHRPKPEPDGGAHAGPRIQRPQLPHEAEVKYIPCPSCNVRMNRTVFGKSSGIVVDVCKAHGTWFDARELTASLAFVERGGIELVEKREKLRLEEERRRAEVERRTQGFEALHAPMPAPMHRMYAVPERLEAVRDILDILLGL
ncbi:MAG TPA: zinc ribbon domain-containing protein [Polyangiaceae bacterium]|nr:zinc ribbon domain-containing protein [Polyangiaceae bacterium]